MEQLERQTGAPAISPGLVADNLESPFAKGLVGRAALHTVLGGAIGVFTGDLGLGLKGVLGSIPLLYLLSPSKMSSALNSWLPRLAGKEGTGNRLAEFIPSAKGRDKFKKAAKSLPYIEELMKKELGRGFLKTAITENWTVRTTARHFSEAREEIEDSFTEAENAELRKLYERARGEGADQINVDNLKTRR